MATAEDEAQENQQTASESSRKRKRISQACENCRDRHIRCDGRRPVCLECHGRGDNCYYATFRIRARNQEPSAVGPEGIDQLSQPPSKIAELTNRDSSLNHNESAVSSTEPPWHDAQSDGLATLAGSNDPSAYGPSSTVAFLRQVLSKHDRQGATTPHYADNGSSQHLPAHQTPTPSVPERLPDSRDGLAVLPTRRNADDFVRCYWEFIHPMFPMLHKPTFMKQYERIWMSDDDSSNIATNGLEMDDVTFSSVLNLVFALGCKFSDRVATAQRNSISDQFYQKSRQVFAFDVFDSTSISVVQLLLLTGVYLQSTKHASRCWNSVGFAIRVAQSLGLHQGQSGHQKTNQLVREMTRRVWHTCVSLDRLLAMTFGRPAMVHESNSVPLPAIIDDEYLSTKDEGSQPAGKPSRLGMFVSSCRLFDLLKEVLSFLSKRDLNTISSQNSNIEINDQVMVVLDLNRRLDQFSQSVPSYLCASEDPASTRGFDSHVHLQRRVLFCRFLLTRLLLLRPMLLTRTKRRSASSKHAVDGISQHALDEDIVQSCCKLCVQTAHRLIDAIYHNVGTLYRSSGWHAVYFTFSAAIVLLASLKCNLDEISAGNAKFEESWGRCLSILGHYESQIHSAAQAIIVLRALREQIGQRDQIPDSSVGPNVATDPAGATVHNSAAPVHPDMLNFEDMDPYSFNDISDAWFGQQLTNLDWLEL